MSALWEQSYLPDAWRGAEDLWGRYVRWTERNRELPVIGPVARFFDDPNAQLWIGMGTGGAGRGLAAGTTRAGSTAAANAAYDAARAGGRHAGTLKNYEGRSIAEIERAIASYQRQVALHADKIANPARAVEGWSSKSAREHTGLINKWRNDLGRNEELADVLRGLLDSLR